MEHGGAPKYDELVLAMRSGELQMKRPQSTQGKKYITTRYEIRRQEKGLNTKIKQKMFYKEMVLSEAHFVEYFPRRGYIVYF